MSDEGEIKKRIRAKLLGLILNRSSYWQDLKIDEAIQEVLDEVKQEFPFEPSEYWQTPRQEFVHWERYLLQIENDLTDREMDRSRQEFHRVLQSWVKGRICDLRWYLKWLGESK